MYFFALIPYKQKKVIFFVLRAKVKKKRKIWRKKKVPFYQFPNESLGGGGVLWNTLYRIIARSITRRSRGFYRFHGEGLFEPCLAPRPGMSVCQLGGGGSQNEDFFFWTNKKVVFLASSFWVCASLRRFWCNLFENCEVKTVKKKRQQTKAHSVSLLN